MAKKTSDSNSKETIMRLMIILVFVFFASMLSTQALTADPIPADTAASSTAATETSPLADRPGADEYTAAKKVVEDLFGSELRKANKPEQKAKLAKELLKIADETKGNNAQRYVLLLMARKLATSGRDKATAFDAVIAMANVFKPNEALLSDKSAGKSIEQRYFDEAQGYWGLAEKNRGMKQLEFQVQAAEWYAYAMPGLNGVKGLLAEKRLTESDNPQSSTCRRLVRNRKSDLELFVGAWLVVNERKEQLIWVFTKNGLFYGNNAIKGKWKASDGEVVISWDDNPKAWVKFPRPVCERMTGDCWLKAQAIRANKIE